MWVQQSKENQTQDEWKGMDVTLRETNVDWLRRCMVGRLCKEEVMINTQEAFFVYGHSSM